MSQNIRIRIACTLYETCRYILGLQHLVYRGYSLQAIFECAKGDIIQFAALFYSSALHIFK